LSRHPIEHDTRRRTGRGSPPYILGGKDNVEADRRAAEAAVKANPVLATGMREIAQSLRPDSRIVYVDNAALGRKP
jgi:hypothetical protein